MNELFRRLFGACGGMQSLAFSVSDELKKTHGSVRTVTRVVLFAPRLTGDRGTAPAPLHEKASNRCTRPRCA